ncbi:MAG TPA: glycosyltransferase family 2 protein [Candidatus Paceibacterota bacterium]|jgi:Glycosyltransferases, probably involved in cell wall biogenesis
MSLSRYYHRCVDEFVAFLTPPGRTDVYEVIKDELGFVPDVEERLRRSAAELGLEGRLVIISHNALWEPLLRLASALNLRRPNAESNWLSMGDLKNFCALAGLEPVKSGTRMILPVYIPLVSALCNNVLGAIWPFSHLGIFHYIVARKVGQARKSFPSLSIVIPARNEMGTIERMARELPNLGSHTELIFVEGNSTDDTWKEIERVADVWGGKRSIKIARQKGRGKGDAVRTGFEKATGDILAIYDADMTVPPSEVEKFYRLLASGVADFANGSRLVYPVEDGAMRILNLIGNKFFASAFSWILGQPLKDTLCGTKVLWRSDYEEIAHGRSYFGDFDPFGDFDLLFGAAKMNLKIIDVPIHYQARVYGETNIRRWSHGLLLLRMTAFAARKIKFV